MSETPRLDLPYLAASQYQKETVHNLSLDRLDLLCQCAVLDRNLTTPPASPALGDAYIVAAGGTGAWATHDNHLALWVSNQWQLIAPLPGFQCWVIDEGVLVYWSGTAWTIITSGGGGATTFLGLLDTPDSYSGQAGKAVIVNAGATGVEFGTLAGSAPLDATYIVSSANTTLSAERVVTDNSTITWDTATAGQLKATIVANAVQLGQMQQILSGSLLGRSDPDVGNVQQISVGAGLTLTGGELSATTPAVATTFLALTDTPETYSGQGGKVVTVNAGGTALEFTMAAGSMYTDEQAQDAVGAMLADTATIALTYTDATPALTAAVIAGSIGTPQLADGGVTYTKMQPVTDNRLLGRSAGSVGDVQEITVGAGLTLAAGELSATGGGGGAPTDAVYIVGSTHAGLSAERVLTNTTTVTWDQTVAGQVSATVPDDAITYAKLQNVSAANRLLGRGSAAGAGNAEEILIAAPLSLSGTTLNCSSPSGTGTGGQLTYWSGTTGLASAAYLQYSPTTRSTMLNGASTGTSAEGVLALGRGIAPTTSPTNTVQLWARERGEVANKTSLHIRTQDGTSHVLGDLSGIGTTAPGEKLEVAGGVKLAAALGTADGTLQWTGTDFEGRKGGAWVSLTSGGGQPLDATLTALAGLATGADQLPYFTGTDSAAQTPLTAAGRALLDDADAAAQRTTLALGTMAQQDANAVAITGGSAALDATVTGRGGFYAPTSTGNNKYALYSDLISAGGTERYGVNIAGDAPNYLAGKLGIGMPPGAAKVSLFFGPASGLATYPNAAGPATPLYFFNASLVNVGSITTTDTATAYNTSSDARLKHAIAPLTGALDVVRRLRPITHLWRVDDSRGYGFLADEVEDALPAGAGVITGARDAVDEKGQIIPQQIDYGKLVPWLTAALNDALGALDTLTARVASLEQQLGV